MAPRFENVRPGVAILALAISVFIWGVAQGTSSVQTSFDVPVELVGVDEGLVITEQSADAINLRLKGSRAALRNLEPDEVTYRIDARGAKPGVAVYEVNVDTISHPTGSQFEGHSPSQIQIRFEKRGRKAVGVSAEVTGTPAPGFHLAGVNVEPERVWLEGARSEVMRLSEVPTEPIDVAGLAASEKRDARLVLAGGAVWVEENKPVQVEIRIEPDPVPEPVLPNLGAGEESVEEEA